MKKIPKCPKCHFLPMTIKEIWECTLEFCLVNGELEEEGIKTDHNGTIKKVVAVCTCGYEWTLRGIKQVTELKT